MRRAWRSIKESWPEMKLFQKTLTVIGFPIVFMFLWTIIFVEAMYGNKSSGN